MKYMVGQTISMRDKCSLRINAIDEDADEISATLINPSSRGKAFDDWIEYDGVSESTITSIIAHHNRR